MFYLQMNNLRMDYYRHMCSLRKGTIFSRVCLFSSYTGPAVKHWPLTGSLFVLFTAFGLRRLRKFCIFKDVREFYPGLLIANFNSLCKQNCFHGIRPQTELLGGTCISVKVTIKLIFYCPPTLLWDGNVFIRV